MFDKFTQCIEDAGYKIEYSSKNDNYLFFMITWDYRDDVVKPNTKLGDIQASVSIDLAFSTWAITTTLVWPTTLEYPVFHELISAEIATLQNLMVMFFHGDTE